MGLLHTKCACGIIWLSNFNIKNTLDEIYNNGLFNIDLKCITVKLAWPVISILSLLLLLPYIIFVGGLYELFGKMHVKICLMLYAAF